ncbi:DUF1963 domain-containing protein [Actinoplanes friuliensis]|uniref:DUF1963 domain-containing protein n=1 Tax=Actinoplanes friuliensis DSM 7358 TaxID=1246995 RepID=U5W557_9ACTN|nr:DUF1963 domain-containing protein [Actinoplanes friuliensis]AGZ44147.1 hypothetical protein AFR_29430 [Actinoplanes friuliensis DSM 7358]
MTLEEYKTKIRTIARSLEISEPITEAVIDLIRPHIELFRHEGGTAGQFGGNPALPDDVPWPVDGEFPGSPEEPVPFAASINCSQLPLDILDIDLPRDGQLLFFSTLDFDDQLGSIVHVPAHATARERHAPEDTYPAPMHSSTLGARVGWSYPYEGPILEDLYRQSSEDHPYHHEDFQRLIKEGPMPDECLIQIGGYFEAPQGHPLWMVEGAPEDWVVLAKITVRDGFRSNTEEEASEYWRNDDADPDGNECCFFYTIRTTDLAGRHFDRAATFLQEFN